MSRSILPLEPRALALSSLALAAIVAGTFGLGNWMGRRSHAETKAPESSTNREVSQKSWITADELKARFSEEKNREFMHRAIENSRLAGITKKTGGAFGAVIVDRDGHIVGEGYNHVVANFDPTSHGEMEAIRDACAKLKVLKLDGCVIYTSSEPCPMCLSTCYWAGLDGIVYGAFYQDSKKYGGFDDSFIYEELVKPIKERKIPEIQVSRDEAVEVWKEYAKQKNTNVAY
jgi:guanine deaminase